MIFASPRSWKIQELAQRVLRGPRLTTIELQPGIPFHCWTSEKYYWFGVRYESELREHLEKALTADGVFYDIGANAGFWPVMFSGGCSRIFAFEPSPKNFSRLIQNVHRFTNVTPVNCIVSDVDGDLPFTEDGTRSGVAEGGELSIKSIRVDDFVEAGNPAPSVVKVDVEGHGARCLAGMTRVLKDPRPVLFVEVHNSEEKEALTNLDEYSTHAIERVESYPFHMVAVPRE